MRSYKAELVCESGAGEPEETILRTSIAGVPTAEHDALLVLPRIAPLSTVGDSSRAPPWERLSRFLYRHGAYFYNFQGLRQYKEKFHPQWEPRYMGYKPPWEWPRAMGAVAALIAGGWPRVVLPARWVNAMGRVIGTMLLAVGLAGGRAGVAPRRW